MAKRDIICVSFIEWEGVYLKSTVKLMSLLAANNRILFVEYAFTYKDVVAQILRPRGIPVARILGLKPRLRSITTPENSQLWLWTPPPVPPYNFFRNDFLFNLFAKLGASLMARSIRRVIKQMDFHEPVVINAFNPFYGIHQVGKLNETATIYYCYDGIAGTRNGPRGARIEAGFMKKIDGVICTSDALAEEKSRTNPNCRVVKNGVDFASFQSVIRTLKPIVNPRPIVSYIGSIDQRIHFQLIQEVANLLPGYDFHFIGRVVNEKAKHILEEIPNIHFFPPVPPLTVPELMFHSNVGIIPYTLNEINQNVYPLKINEYLAVGTPVVMTGFARLPEFDAIVKVASEPETFTQALRDAVDFNSQKDRNLRMDFASKNSWDQRASDFENAIDHIVINR